MKNKKDIIICDCKSTEHQMIFLYEEEYDEKNNMTYPICYAHIHLNNLSFFKRLKYGIKYIFGHKSIYGAFDEFIFDKDDAYKIQKLANYLKSELGDGTKS